MKSSLVVLPTQDTVARLRKVFDMAPFSPVYEKMILEICSADGGPAPWTEQPSNVYTDVKVVKIEAQARYLENIPTRILVADCVSPSLSARAREFGASLEKFPWVITTDLQVSRTVRVFLASLNNTMVLHEAPFSFTGEVTLQNG